MLLLVGGSEAEADGAALSDTRATICARPALPMALPAAHTHTHAACCSVYCSLPRWLLWLLGPLRSSCVLRVAPCISDRLYAVFKFQKPGCGFHGEFFLRFFWGYPGGMPGRAAAGRPRGAAAGSGHMEGGMGDWGSGVSASGSAGRRRRSTPRALYS